MKSSYQFRHGCHGYFKCDDWLPFFDKAIYFDSFNRLIDEQHENIFRTRISFGFQDAVDQIKALFPNTKITFPILSDKNKLDKRFETYLQHEDYIVALTGVCDVFSTRRDQGVASSVSTVLSLIHI